MVDRLDPGVIATIEAIICQRDDEALGIVMLAYAKALRAARLCGCRQCVHMVPRTEAAFVRELDYQGMAGDMKSVFREQDEKQGETWTKTEDGWGCDTRSISEQDWGKLFY